MMFKKRWFVSLILGEKDKNEKIFGKSLTTKVFFSIIFV